MVCLHFGRFFANSSGRPVSDHTKFNILKTVTAQLNVTGLFKIKLDKRASM
jgi:hypothetical protein